MTESAHLLRLLSLAGHELRTPAGVIGGALRLIRAAGDAAPERRDRALAQAERNYERLVEILGEMSDVWRLEAGEATFNRQALALRRVLDNAIRLAAARASEVADVRLVATDPLPAVIGDPTRMERAFAAFVLATARRLHDTPSFVVQVLPPGPATVVVAVAASDADVAAAVSSPRVPLDEFEGGLGLALPIARRVVEAEGGSVATAGDARVIVVELPVHRPEP